MTEKEPRRARAESLDTLLRSRFSAAEAEAMIGFARGLFAREGEAYAAGLADEDQLALIAAAYRFFASMPRPVRCRARTPTVAIDGWDSPYTIFESHLTDRPFIVDTLRECLDQKGIAVRALLHPIFSVERDANGDLLRMRSVDAAAQRESFIHCAVDRLPDDEVRRLERELAERLHEVYRVTEDYPRMRQRVRAVRGQLAAPWPVDAAGPSGAESAAFLAWLVSGNFVLLGYDCVEPGTDGTRETDGATALGILRATDRSAATLRQLAVESAAAPSSRLVVTRSSVVATVHRAAPLDVILARTGDPSAPTEHRFVGLFTSKAYDERSSEMPVLRQMLRKIFEAEQVLPESHDFREIEAIFDEMPKAELFMLTPDEIRAEIRSIRSVSGADSVRVRFRPHRQGAWATVILPRERFSGALRREIEALFSERLGGSVVDFRLALGEEDQARLHFYFASAPYLPDVRVEEVEARVAEHVRSWDDRLREQVLAQFPGAQGRELVARYSVLFTPEYKATTEIPSALDDIRHIEALVDPASVEVAVANGVGEDIERFTVLKLYLRGEGIVLSDFLPLLENLGMRVFGEDSVVLGEGQARIALYRFRVQNRRGARLDVRTVAPRLVPALLAVHAGVVENDSLNRLVVETGLSWREIDLLRLFRNLAFQGGAGPSRIALNEVFLAHPIAARALFEIFSARLDPAANEREGSLAEARAQFDHALEKVETSAEDQMLRNLRTLVESTLRTNFFRPPRAEHPFLAVKIQSEAIDFLPKPRPLCEIYVHSARMEGIHLRSGRVARGGIRWSDRPDDFRAEVLGLMKTQMVKNAVIVPVGSKGGFVVKQPKTGAEGAAEVRGCYSTLIRGLLELTDNIVRGEIVPPAGVVRVDTDDPYLVVAADKGTATFSDLANAIAAESSFWLGDAFASGGSHGYDHKKEGITARGAWKCVQRHFRELGKDIQAEPFDVVGVGDMSGDVFGNGMLLSPAIRLRAAFNHAHVFLDPSPDPVASLRERQRLFRLPGSTWADYDRNVLSRGGMVLSRGAKSATLTPEVRAMLGLEIERLHGEGLVRAVLGMKSELLWNGGIGTYVRAASETNAEAGDRANDPVRIVAAGIGASVVGEGGNLGLTQKARIEFALRGGRINTDAIDNSGGVDLSDHEVNLKILFQPLLEAGTLTSAQRNRWLEQAKDEVIEQVLAHNVRQSLLLSLDALRSATRLVEFRDLMVQLEQDESLDRALEVLPDRETLSARRGAFRGLTRPELAVLAAHAKLHLQRELVASPWIDDPALERFLFAYFPRAIGERFAAAVRSHRLRREIIAAELGGRVVDLMGAAFAQRMLRDATVDAPTAVASFVAVLEMTEADRIFDTVAAAPIRADDLHALCLRWEAATEAACKRIVAGLERPGAIGEHVRVWRADLAAIADAATPENDADPEVDRLEQMGIDAGTARSLRALERLAGQIDVIRVAHDTGRPLAAAAHLHAEVARLLDFGAIERWFDATPGDDRWEKRAAEVLRAELSAARRALTAILLESGDTDSPDGLRAFAAGHESDISRLRTLIDDFADRRQVSIAAAVVVVREVWRLAGRR